MHKTNMLRQTTKESSEKCITAFQGFIFILYLMRKTRGKVSAGEKKITNLGLFNGPGEGKEVATTF